jgi:hypothetical protein
MTRAELVQLVQIRIDENSSQPQAAVVETTTIEKELDLAAEQLVASVPKHFLYGVADHFSDRCILNSFDGDPHSVTIPLPAGFKRFISVRLDNWKVPAEDLVTTDTEQYRRQFSIYEMATAYDPIAAFVPYKNGQLRPDSTVALQAFPAPTDLRTYQKLPFTPDAKRYVDDVYANTTLYSGKVPLVKDCVIVTAKTAEHLPTVLHDAVVYLAASRILASLQLPQIAQVAEAKAAASIVALRVGFLGEEQTAGRQAR